MARRPNSMRKGVKVASVTKPKRKKVNGGKAIPSDISTRYKVAARKPKSRRA